VTSNLTAFKVIFPFSTIFGATTKIVLVIFTKTSLFSWILCISWVTFPVVANTSCVGDTALKTVCWAGWSVDTELLLSCHTKTYTTKLYTNSTFISCIIRSYNIVLFLLYQTWYVYISLSSGSFIISIHINYKQKNIVLIPGWPCYNLKLNVWRVCF